MQVRQELLRFLWSVLLALPLLGNSVAQRLGYRVFYLEDGYLQLFWATLLQIGVGRLFYQGAFRSARMGRIGLDWLVAVVSSLLYGYSLYHTRFAMPSGRFVLHYDTAAGLIVLANLYRLVAALITERRPRRSCGQETAPCQDM